MSEPLLETANFPQIIVHALRKAKEHVYHVENLCTDEDLKRKIVKWAPASAEDVGLVKNEIERVYKLCLEKALGKARSTVKSDRMSPYSLIDHLQSLVSKRWRFLSTRKLRDETSGRVYLIHGWDASPVGPSRIASKLGLGSKGIDAWILLAHNFSPKALEAFGSRPDVAMISLSNNVISGGLSSDDALLRELVEVSKSFSQNPERSQYSAIDNDTGIFRVRDAARVFRDHFEISDCGHLHLTAPHGLQGLYSSRQPTIEEKLERPGMLHPASSTDDDPKEILNQMEKYRDYLLKRLDELSSSEFAVATVRRDLAGTLGLAEVRFLCKTCGREFSEVYEFPEDPPVRGLQLPFIGFVARVAQELQANAEFVEICDMGVIRTGDGNLIIMMHPVNQPAANLNVFNPRLTVVVCNFFRDRWRKPALTVVDPLGYGWWREGEGAHWMGPKRAPDDPKASVFAAVSSYLVPSVAFDCLTESHEYMEVTSAPAELASIVERIRSIDLTVKPTEKAFKAAHDRLLEEFRTMGLFFGYDTQVEYRVGPDRLDVAWINRSTRSVDVAIEVELGNNPTGELWKLVELQPMLAVLAVKGNQYDQTLMRIAKSKILRNLAQTLMVLDVSEKRSVLVRGNDILRTEHTTALSMDEVSTPLA